MQHFHFPHHIQSHCSRHRLIRPFEMVKNSKKFFYYSQLMHNYLIKVYTIIVFCVMYTFDVEYIYGFVMLGGFVRQVDDVTAQPFQRTVTPARATP